MVVALHAALPPVGAVEVKIRAGAYPTATHRVVLGHETLKRLWL
jgi:hypothetical protein